ncbi:hypothetical protein ABMA28_006140 [Loxostege sticticalis]|uniref:Uncharacterized protein n=1 Tax=Loxostege sticticalis TaxID=481309 RepID=A0ABD0SK57_LOXSC
MQGYPELAAYTFELFSYWSHKKYRPLTPPPFKLSKPPRQTEVQPPQETEAETTYDQTDDMLTILTNEDRPRAVEDYEADHSSSGEEDSDMGSVMEPPKYTAGDKVSSTKTEPPSETDPLPQIMQCKTEPEDSDTEMSMMIMSEDESIKSEPPEWKRDEDKLILEVLKMNLSPEERKDTNKSILEILEEKHVLEVMTESLVNKSIHDVKDRMMYLLNLLLLRET